MPSPTQLVRDQIFAAIASGASTEGFDHRRVSEIRKRCFGVSKNKVISRTNEIERATAKLMALNLNPSEELINTALGWTGVSIPVNRISEGKTWAKLINRGTEVIVNLGQERLETLSKERGLLISQPRRKPRLVRRPRTNDHAVIAKGSMVRQQVENLHYTAPLQDAIDAQCALTGTTPTQHDENGGDIIFLDFVIEVKREARDFKYALKVLRDAEALTRELDRTMRPVIALPSEPLDWERDLARSLGVLVWIYPPKLKLYNDR